MLGALGGVAGACTIVGANVAVDEADWVEFGVVCGSTVDVSLPTVTWLEEGVAFTVAAVVAGADPVPLGLVAGLVTVPLPPYATAAVFVPGPFAS